jgi:hypothetical protein
MIGMVSVLVQVGGPAVVAEAAEVAAVVLEAVGVAIAAKVLTWTAYWLKERAGRETSG